MIKIEHLKLTYPSGITPFKDLNTEIHPGEVISVIGPSGTGKSSLLRCINMLEKPTSGKIFLHGEEITTPGYDLTKMRLKVGMVFQSFNLFNHMKVVENVMAPQVHLLKRDKQNAYEKSMTLLKKVGMAEWAMKYPDELSGGQKQRVAIARTLSIDPEIILFDEPTSALDPTMVGEVEYVIRDLAESGTTMMIVTHEMRFAKSISNRVFYLDQGGIYEDGSPEQIFDHPLRERTKAFVNRLKVLHGSCLSKDFDYMGLITKLNEYSLKCHMSPKLYNAIISFFEELVLHKIVAAIPGNERIIYDIEYSEENENIVISLRYNGQKFNPIIKDSLEIKVLSSYFENINYKYDESEQVNNIKATISMKAK